MDLDSYIFKKIYNFFSGLVPEKGDANAENRYNSLPSLKHLAVFASLISGRAVEVTAHKSSRFLFGETRITVPAEWHRYQSQADNYDFYLLKILMHSRQKTSEPPDNITEKLYDAASLENLINKEQFAALFSRPFREQLSGVIADYPVWQDRFGNLLRQEIRYQAEAKKGFSLDLFTTADFFTEKKSAGLTATDTELAKDDTITTELTLNLPEEDVEIHEVDKKAKEDYTLGHNFEKIETVEEFQGLWRDFDAEDDLDDHSEALSETPLKHMVRTDDAVHSVLHSESFRNILASESRKTTYSNEFFINYDEWDFLKKSYRKDHCQVFPAAALVPDPLYAETTLARRRSILLFLKKKIAMMFNQLEQVKRMPSGDEPDLEALVDNFACRKAGHTPSENVYLSKRKRKKELSILLLADISLSSDSFYDGKRILDMEKEAILIFGEILGGSGERFQVDGFSSRTRNRLDYITAKHFNDDWQKRKPFVAGLSPQGYTRIGPAIRHAAELLKKEPSRHKWILLLSDAKPNDYDRYEGNYGIRDVSHAVREAKKSGINLHAMVTSSQASSILPEMFGKNGFTLFTHLEQLPVQLTDFYSRIASFS